MEAGKEGENSMSGGSMDYGYVRVIGMVDQFEHNTPERKAFADHLGKVAKALHDIEWVDSGDYEPGDENEAIRVCIGEEAIKAVADIGETSV